jgi:hypothetical protein
MIPPLHLIRWVKLRRREKDAEEPSPCTSGYAPGKSTKRFPAELINRRGRSTQKESQEVH